MQLIRVARSGSGRLGELAVRFIVFSDKMIDGVAEIDHQHSCLVDIINALYDIALNKNARTTLVQVFEDLDRHIDEHFECEERLFAEAGYPLAKEHRATHEAFRQRIADYRASTRNANGTLVAAELLHLLKQWMTGHMQNDDRDACRHLNASGIR
jgi:hemerythrin-like metal-binding protein